MGFPLGYDPMGGSNPYIDKPEYVLPTQPYDVHYQPMDKKITVDPAKIPYGHNGLEGSLLDIALANGVDIDHACGGVAACSTCHVIVEEGLETCNATSDAEDDQLENAVGLTLKSRLACQCVPNGTKKMVVRVPDWNRNLVRE
jgi:2Fe-2S ferredoxin